MLEVQPSGLREVFVDLPNITWDNIGGLAKVKKDLIKVVEWPLKYPEIFKEFETDPPNGILLYGPPGTGKTLLAKAIANETQANFISVKGPEFLSKWVGESEKAVRETFRKAKLASPCIIFFDEIESIVPIRGIGSSTAVTEGIVSQLLTEMDGLEELKGIVVIAATNRPDIIDPALLRPGRFDKKIEIPLPDRDTRVAILKVHLKGKLLSNTINIEGLADKLTNKSGAEIQAFVKEAIMTSIQRYVEEKTINNQLDSKGWIITDSDFEIAFNKINEYELADKQYEERSLKSKNDSSYM